MAESTIVRYINAVYTSSADKLKAELPSYLKVVKAYPKVGKKALSNWKGRDVAFLLDTLFPQYAEQQEVSRIEQVLVEQEFLDRDYLDDQTIISDMDFSEIDNILQENKVPLIDKQKFMICVRYLFGIISDIATTG